ncbi:MAG: hypothetical protein AAFP84_03475 [Actinomycetota bacterium]
MTDGPERDEPDDRAAAVPAPPDRAPGTGDEAIAVDTNVREDRGRWIVEISVVFHDGAIRRTVNDYPTRRHAEIAASWIRRAADRDIEGPIHG